MADQVINPVMFWAHDQNNAQTNCEVKTYRNFTESIAIALTTAHFFGNRCGSSFFQPQEHHM